MLSSMTYIFDREGFSIEEALSHAQSCLPYCIMCDSYQWYLVLFRHLVGKAQTESWAIVKLVIHHLVTKINSICTGHSGMLVIIMCHYALLKDGFGNQWQSNLVTKSQVAALEAVIIGLQSPPRGK
eukprot:13406852-Ditylum_brightwellii.AAC.1